MKVLINQLQIKNLLQLHQVYKIDLHQSQKINCIVLKEDIATGQKIKSFTIQLQQKNNTVKEVHANTVGKKRILTFPATEADSIIIKIDEAKATPLLDEVSAYLIDEKFD